MNGKIVLGNNASGDLKKMAALISEKGNPVATAMFDRLAKNRTKIHFTLETAAVANGLHGLHAAHDKNGKQLSWDEKSGTFRGTPKFIKDSNQQLVFAEVSITIFAKNIVDSLEQIRMWSSDECLTAEEYMVAAFTHEGVHDEDRDAIQAIQDRLVGRPNSYDVESLPYSIMNHVLGDLKKRRAPESCIR